MMVFRTDGEFRTNLVLNRPFIEPACHPSVPGKATTLVVDNDVVLPSPCYLLLTKYINQAW